MLDPQRVLIVDDDEGVRRTLSLRLRRGHDVEVAVDGRDAIQKLEQEAPFDLILTDYRMPGLGGLDVARYVHDSGVDTAVVLMSAFHELDAAVEAMQLGALDFIPKPFDLTELETRLSSALERRRSRPSLYATPGAPSPGAAQSFLGEDPAVVDVRRLIEHYAPTDGTVLVTGESGTGKEVVARAIHEASPRKNGPFVAINCGALPPELLESELFGHAKGAFTGAVRDHRGRFEQADGGTIFLDEVGEMPLRLQVKLLRVLQERRFTPVGSQRELRPDFRIIAATNKDLATEVRESRFREDLFYRLCVLPIETPALRDRPVDLGHLVKHYLPLFSDQMGCAVHEMSPEALSRLQAHRWPGNVRELENVLLRMVVMKREGRLELEDLPPELSGTPRRAMQRAHIPPTGIDFNAEVERYENELIIQALRITGGNRKQAAALLGLNRTTLVEKLKRKGLDVDAILAEYPEPS